MGRGIAIAIRGAALLAALVAAAVPASAADVAQLGCPVEGLNAAERERLEDHVRRQGDPAEAAIQPFFRGVERCRARHGWSEAAARQSIMFHLSVIGQRVARRTLQQQGVDVAAIERALLADPAAVAAARRDDAGERLGAFYDALPAALRAPVEQAGESAAHLLGTYLLFRAAMETSRADFAAR